MLVAGLRSRNGASFQLLSELATEAPRFELVVSVPLVLEYEAVLLRLESDLALSRDAITAFLDYLCLVGEPHEIFFLWRPFLKDPKDDMVLELAVAAAADAIVTFNQRDFRRVDRFSMRVIGPRALWEQLGDKR